MFPSSSVYLAPPYSPRWAQPGPYEAGRGLGSWVAVASLNPSHSGLGSQVFHHPTELSPYQPWSCCSPAMFGLGT